MGQVRVSVVAVDRTSILPHVRLWVGRCRVVANSQVCEADLDLRRNDEMLAARPNKNHSPRRSITGNLVSTYRSTEQIPLRHFGIVFQQELTLT